MLSCNITHFHYCVKSTFLSQDEMFIFMEYCAEGTISDVSKNDLPEDMIRMYTNQILVAVSVLHEKGIVHRDVKGKVLFFMQCYDSFRMTQSTIVACSI